MLLIITTLALVILAGCSGGGPSNQNPPDPPETRTVQLEGVISMLMPRDIIHEYFIGVVDGAPMALLDVAAAPISESAYSNGATFSFSLADPETVEINILYFPENPNTEDYLVVWRSNSLDLRTASGDYFWELTFHPFSHLSTVDLLVSYTVSKPNSSSVEALRDYYIRFGIQLESDYHNRFFTHPLDWVLYLPNPHDLDAPNLMLVGFDGEPDLFDEVPPGPVTVGIYAVPRTETPDHVLVLGESSSFSPAEYIGEVIVVNADFNNHIWKDLGM